MRYHIYKKATRILKNHDLHIERREFYNLTRTENLKKLKPDKELTLLLSILDSEDFRIRYQESMMQGIIFMINTESELY